MTDTGKGVLYEISDDYALIFSNIEKRVKSYLSANRGLESLVVGVSGGIDSALTCVLASEILAAVPGVTLIGRILPIESNKEEEITRGEAIGRLFCHDWETRDLTAAYHGTCRTIVSGSRAADTSRAEKIRKGNIKARIRMIYLFDLAHLENGMVLSTDNLTELLLGFWTLHGDVGNFGFLQYLWKTEVYGLARYFAEKYRKAGAAEKAAALEKCIDAVPTDGLGITSSDFDQLEVPDYRTADRIFSRYFKGDAAQADHPVIKRYRVTRFKRRDPQNITREALFSE